MKNVRTFSGWLFESQRWCLPLETVVRYVNAISTLLPKRGLSKVHVVEHPGDLDTVHLYFSKKRFNEEMKYVFEIRGYNNEMAITHKIGPRGLT